MTNNQYIKNFRIVAAVILTLLLTLAGCGANKPAENVTQAPVEASAQPQTTTGQPQTTAVASAPDLIIEEIEDTDISVALPDISGYIESDLPPVAQVASFPVTQPEYRYMLNHFKSSVLLNTGIERNAKEAADFWDRVASNGKTRLDEAREKILSELHQLKVCAEIAKNRGIELELEDLQNVGTDLRAQISRFGSRADFEKVLMSEYGVNLAEYILLLESVMLRDKLYSIERESINLTENEIRSYYEQHLDEYGDKIRLRQILFFMEGTDLKAERTPEDTRKLADKTLSDIKSGADMAALATEKSEDPNAPYDGGERIVARSDPFTPDAVLAWAFGAKAGDSAVVEEAHGYYVVRVEERIVNSFEDSKPAIEDVLRDRKLAEKIAGWLKDPAYAMKVNKEVLESII